MSTGEPQITRASAAEMAQARFDRASIVGPIQPEIQAAINQHVQGNSETALRIIKGDLLPYTNDDITKALQEKLSTERDAHERKIAPTNAQEIARITQSEQMAKAVRDYVENNTISPQLRTTIANYLKTSSPAFADAISAGADANAMAQSILNDAAYKDTVRQIYIEVFDPSKKLTKEDAVKQIQVELAKLNAKLKDQVTPAELAAKKSAVAKAESNIATIHPQVLELESKSEEYQELSKVQVRYKQDMNRLRPIVDPLLADVNQLRVDLAALNPASATYAADRASILGQVAKIESDPNYKSYIFRDSEVKRYGTLTKEIAALQVVVFPVKQALEQAQQELTELQQKQKNNISATQKAEVEADIKVKEAELADAKDELNTEMLKFARDSSHIAQDATEAYINGAFEGMKQVWKEERKKSLEKDASDKNALAQSALEKLSNKWKKDKKVKGITIKTPDKGRALKSFVDVFKPGGLENIAANIDSMTNAELTAMGLNLNEITALRAKMTDKEFRKTASDAFTKEAIADYFLSGGRLDQELVNSLTSTEEGQKLLADARAKVEGSLKLNTVQKEQLVEFDKLVKGKKEGAKFPAFMWAGAIIALLIMLGLFKAGGG